MNITSVANLDAIHVVRGVAIGIQSDALLHTLKRTAAWRPHEDRPLRRVRPLRMRCAPWRPAILGYSELLLTDEFDIVKEIVGLLRGDIVLNSSPGQGTTVKVWLPLVQQLLTDGQWVTVPAPL